MKTVVMEKDISVNRKTCMKFVKIKLDGERCAGKREKKRGEKKYK